MRVIDPGHRYELAALDGGEPQILQFVKRIGAKYPGNEGAPCGGVTIQEVLRALINRCEYVNGQVPCAETELDINLLRGALFLLETRARRRKGETLEMPSVVGVENEPTCAKCGHIRCERHQ